MKYDKGTIVVEIAGRDSIAALIKYALDNPGNYFLPTIAMIPPEEDRYYETLSYLQDLARYLFKKGSIIYDPVYFDLEESWWKVNKPAHEIMAKYGFFTYCLGCHGVVHAARIPLAKTLSKKVITGERYRHGDKVKINQSPMVIDAYSEFFMANGIEHITPILDIKDKAAIDDIMSEFERDYLIEDIKPIDCYLSGSADGLDSSTLNLQMYLDDFLIHILQDIVNEMEEENGI